MRKCLNYVSLNYWTRFALAFNLIMNHRIYYWKSSLVFFRTDIIRDSESQVTVIVMTNNNTKTNVKRLDHCQ